MDELPDLERLSITEKDALIRELWPLRGLVRDLMAQVSTLTAKVAELEARLALNSRNSSKPPSSDGLNKPKPKSLRKPGERPPGGQKGHKGSTLAKVAEPDMTVRHPPPPPLRRLSAALARRSGRGNPAGIRSAEAEL
jgi:transposase